MNSKHRRTLAAIFVSPIPSDIRWVEVEALLIALGAERSEGRGSRVRFLLNGQEAVFPRPHPRPETIASPSPLKQGSIYREFSTYVSEDAILIAGPGWTSEISIELSAKLQFIWWQRE